MSDIADPSVIDQATAALGRHAWGEAFDLLSATDARGELSPGELELLAQASWWVGHLQAAIDARERAYAGYIKADQPVWAAAIAVRIGSDNLLKNAQPVATAWLNRAERLLEGHEEGVGHGGLAVARALLASMTGHFEEAQAESIRAREIAARLGDPNLAAIALSIEGVSLINRGQVEAGLAMVDEATVAAVGGEIDPFTAGGVSCAAISACSALGDWARAIQWTEAQDRWCQREHISGFPGMCRLHRAEIKGLHGAWLEAETEARRASDELEGFIPAAVGQAFYQIGILRLRRGDQPAAEDALLRAHSYGREPEPALSLLRLAQGRPTIASASIRQALDEPARQTFWAVAAGPEINRLILLPAQVEIALAAADLPTARAAAEELASLADRFASPAGQASASWARGATQIAAGDPHGAIGALRRAIGQWRALDAPYDAAKAQLALADAYAASGDRETAALEAQTARAVFERLGATPDLRRADELLAAVHEVMESRPLPAQATRVGRAFVFTDIVDSTRLAELLGDDAWDSVIRWHDQAVRALAAEYRGEEIKRTGDGFFLAFDDVDRAIEGAIAIQRRLADQREKQGFAPAIRIGIHWAEANRSGLDYLGAGVNQAARIGAVAGAAEILVSASTLDRTRRSFVELERRTASLKGLSAPVEVASISWR